MSNSLDDTIKKYCDDLMQIYKNKTELKCDSSNLNEAPSTEPFADLNENNLNNQNKNKNKANQQNFANKNTKTYPWPNSDKNNN